MTFLRSKLKVVVLAASSLLPCHMDAQQVVAATNGIELRYHGDAIWRMRDSTMSQLVIRGDTGIRSLYVHGKLMSTQTYVQRGDVSLLIDDRDGNGKSRGTPDLPRPSPALMITGDIQMVEIALRERAMKQRMAGLNMPSNDAPLSPPDVRSYAFSPNTNIVQHLDTVRYIRGCVAAPPVETTTYLLFASDSVRRLSPDPRTFDRYMAAAVRADMGTAILRQRINEMPAQSDVPRLTKWPCDKRP